MTLQLHIFVKIIFVAKLMTSSQSNAASSPVICPELDNFEFDTTPPMNILRFVQCGDVIQPGLHLYLNKDQKEPCNLDPFHLPNQKSKECFEKLVAATDVNKLVILIHGFMNSKETEWVNLSKTGIHNHEPNTTAILVVDWSEHMEGFKDYFHSASSTRYMGKVIQLAMKQMFSLIMEKKLKTHCIGYSLGAHVCGFAGKFLNAEQDHPDVRPFDRITGLDPAGPLFASDLLYVSFLRNRNPEARLAATDAKIVDVIHTNPTPRFFNLIIQYGSIDRFGTVDFFIVNKENDGFRQAGCNMKDEVFQNCSHKKVQEYFVSFLNKEKCAVTTKCDQVKDANFVKNCKPFPDDVKTVVPGYWYDQHDMEEGVFLIRAGETTPFCVK